MITIDSGPDWVAAEMPPGYNNRLEEIKRLSEDLRAMGRFGRLLWTVGDDLADAVQEAFVALKFDAHRTPASAASSVVVNLDSRRRLLLHVSASQAAIQKKSSELAQVFQVLHELAGETDRHDPIEPQALELLRRMGTNVLPARALFALWMLSLEDRDRARNWIDRLHAQDGGTLELPRSERLTSV